MRAVRSFLPAAGAGLGVGVTAAHWSEPLGAAGGPLAVAVSTVGAPAFVLGALLVVTLLAAAPRVLPALLPATGESCPRARRRALTPLAAGLTLPALTPALDPWTWGCPAPALLWTGAAVGGLATAWRLLALRSPGAARSGGWRVGALATIALTLLVPGWPGPQGDEPHYLLVAGSVARDGDLDLADDYGDGDYRAYHPSPLSPHYKPGLLPGSRYSMHGPGYGALLAPVVATTDAVGAGSPVAAARLLQVLAYGLFAWLLHGVIAAVAGARAAYPGTAAAVLAAPLLLAPLHLFPETLLMLLGVAAYRLMGSGKPAASLAAGLALAALPWLAVKTIPLALVLAALGIWAHGAGGWRRMLPVAAPVAVSLALHAAFTWSVYGSLSPSALYLGSDPSFGRQPGYGDSLGAYLADWPIALRTLVGYFVDQKEGLLFTGPHWLLAAAGLPWLWRHRRRHLLVLLLAFLAYIGPYALSQQIGGQSPPSRPLMAVLWMLAVPLGAGLAVRGSAAVQVLRGVLLTLSAALTVTLVANPALLPHDYPVTRSWLLRSLSPHGSGLADWFPLWLNVREAWPWGVALAWLVLVVAATIVLVRGAGPVPQQEGPARGNRRAWAAATVCAVAAGGLMLHAANLVVSDRHVSAEIAEGVVAWVRYAVPETAWAEPGGVWVAPGAFREVVLTADPPVDAARVRLRSLVPTTVMAWLGGRRVTMSEEQTVTELDWQPDSGWVWRGTSAERLWLYAAEGASPAEVEGGEDHRRLGVFLQLRRTNRER